MIFTWNPTRSVLPHAHFDYFGMLSTATRTLSGVEVCVHHEVAPRKGTKGSFASFGTLDNERNF